MSILKRASLGAIDIVAKFNSYLSVTAVEKIINFYASRTSFETPETAKDFHDVVRHASQAMAASQKSDHLEDFFVGLLRYNFPDKMNDEVFKYIQKKNRPSSARSNLIRFARTTENVVLADKAMDIIIHIESNNKRINDEENLKREKEKKAKIYHYDMVFAVDHLDKILKESTNSKIKAKAFEKLCGIGIDEAYHQAIDSLDVIAAFDKKGKGQDYLVSLIASNESVDRLPLLLKCQEKGIVVGVANTQKVFEAFCELSKLEKSGEKLAPVAAAAANKMLFEYKDGQYPNIDDLAPVLLDVVQRNPSPQSLEPLFNEVSNPEKGLGDFVVKKFSIKIPQNNTTLYPKTNLIDLFAEIDDGNAKKGSPTQLTKIFMLLREITMRDNKVTAIRAEGHNLG